MSEVRGATRDFARELHERPYLGELLLSRLMKGRYGMRGKDAWLTVSAAEMLL